MSILFDGTTQEEEVDYREPEPAIDDSVEPNYFDADGYMTTAHPAYNPSKNIVQLIDGVITNTLSQTGTIEYESAKTLHILTDIRDTYMQTA